MNAKHLILSSIVFVACLVATDASAATINVPPKFIPGTGLSNGLVGWWTFDGKDVPNGRANDVSGNANHGTLTSIATSTFYVPGKIGQGFRFDGVDDYINTGATSMTGVTSITVSAWVKANPVDFDGSAIMIADDSSGNPGSNDGLYFSLDDRAGVGQATNGILATVDRASGNACTMVVNNVITPGIWHHVVMMYSSSGGGKVYFNGIEESLDFVDTDCNGGSNFNPDTDSNHNIGRRADGASYFKGSLDDVRIYNRVLTAAEIRQLYNIGAATRQADSPPVTATSSCRYGPSCGLIAYWTFDGKDMPAGRATDVSGNGNHATLVSIATSTFYVPGKLGQAVNVDGIDDKINGGSATILDDIATTNGGFTASMWVKLKSYGGLIAAPYSSYVISKETNTGGGAGWGLSVTDTNDLISFVVRSSGTDLSVVSAASTFTSSNLNKWVHLAVTWDGSVTATNVHIYKNGSEISYSSQTDATGALDSDAALNLTVGAGTVSSDTTADGAIDDVRVYNRVLSATEIGDMYTTSSSGKIAVSPKVTATSTCSTGLSCGLVGYWTFDGKDTPWTSATAATTLDKSGNGGTGTLTAMSQNVTPSPGIAGQALKFRGNVGEYVQVADADRYSFGNGTTDTPFSLSAWVYYDSTNIFGVFPIIGKWASIGNAEWYLSVVGTNVFGSGGAHALHIQMNTSGGVTNRFRKEGRSSLPILKWSYVTMTYDGSSTIGGIKLYVNGVEETTDSQTDGTYVAMSNLGATVDIGAIIRTNATFDSFAKGKIDEVRIYNRALSASEIRQLYNLGR